MRFFVFLLGAVLIVAGATSIVFGIDIIQVERGWTEVISGTMVLAAGAVIIALGCVIAKLDQVLKATTQSGNSSVRLPPAPGAVPMAPANNISDETGGVPASANVPPGTNVDSDRNWPPALAAVEVSAGVAGAHSPNGHWSPDEHWPAQPANAPGETAVAALQDKPTTVAKGGSQGAAAEPGSESNFEWLERALSGTDEPLRRDERREPAHDSATPNASDQDLSDLGQAAKDRRLEREDKAKPGTTPLAEEQRLADGTDTESQHHTEEVQSAPRDHSDTLAPTAADPAILGRYQANGNSYVMFSDGSIEAVTQTGVYRFSSMAELKAFIEAQA